ncbi:MAG: MFS transporter [Alphaproteobacteria bacterium]|nr:MFS transporter [Alphaproteobacteria bacterium]MBU2041351.1 MFS transporter [Alphaproteobacteria bacterium]MBU2125380.1 MFS transporter [Alphaproteobacteria bacterium]MBU2209542.1 MFS transporter [Alphaproteobacteria bacterium]MBU2290020.1 MFS transporter [Alphaproteobacteria bacterium]
MIVMLSRQQHFDSSGTASSLIYTTALFATALMGLTGGALLRRISNRFIGVSTGLLSALIALVAIVHDSVAGNLTIVGLLFFVCALDNPNINATLNRLLPASSRASGFSTFHTINNAALIAAPIVAVSLVQLVGGAATLAVAALCFVVSAIPWLLLPKFVRVLPNGSPSPSHFEGYGEILRNTALRDLTISRLLNNLIYTAIPVALPILASRLTHSPSEFLWLQGASLATFRGGALASSLVAAFMFARRPYWTIYAARAATPLGIVCLLVLAITAEPLVVILATGFGGVGQFSFRLSGLTLGPSVTPPDLLGEVILAGDTVVRLYSSGYSYLVAMSFTVLGGPILLVAAALASVPAPFLIEKAVRAYRLQLAEPSTKEPDSVAA